MPRLGRWALEKVLARDRVDDIVGDLEERFAARRCRDGAVRARWWYAREVLLLCLEPTLLRTRRPPPIRGLVHGLAADLRFSVRLMSREPLASAAIVLTLAIGIGATTTVVSGVDRFLVRLPDGIHQPERVVEVYRQPLREQDARTLGYDGFRVLTQAAFRTLSDATTLEGASLLSPGWTLSVGVGATTPERLEASFVSTNYFALLGVRFARGRGFDAGADPTGSTPVVVLSHAYWERRFDRNPDVLGRSLRIEGRDLAVVGVAEPGFVGTSVARAPDVWIPLSMIEVIPLWGARAATTGMFIGVARLRDGATLAGAEAELARIGAEYYGQQSTFRVAPLRQVTVDPNRRAGFLGMGAVLLGSVLILLLIACLNVANILLARSIRRQREFAVRVALGAGRARLVRQLFTESALLYVVGGLGGIALLIAVRPWIGSIRPPGRFFFSNPTLDLPFDLRVLAVTLLSTGLCAIIFGVLPAWRALQNDPRPVLYPHGSAATRGRIRSRDTLVVLQVAFCLVALAGAGVFVRSLQAARTIDPGFDPRNTGMISLNLHYAGYGRDQQHLYYGRAIEAARSVPGITAAGISWLRPLEFGPVYGMRPSADAPPEQRFQVHATAVTPGYLEAAGVPLLAGRDFRASDRRASDVPPARSPYVVILNARAAELAWPGEPPETAVGRTIYGGFVAVGIAEVIGVVPTGRQITMGEDPTPAVFTALEQMITVPTATPFFRTDGPLAPGVLQEVAARLRAADAAVHVHDIEAASALVDRALWGARAAAGALSALATIGLLLAALGIYGVVSSTVGERRREMGIRLALGAGHGRVYHLVIGRVFIVVVIGIVIGFGAVAAAGRVAAGQLYGIPPTDPMTLAVVAGCLLLAALLAAYVPARQATQVDPLEVLRSE